jgi:hypothetical protein
MNCSSVDFLREIPKQWGWAGVKDDSYRQCLSYLKAAAESMNHYPTRYLLERRSAMPFNSVNFYHIREPEQIELFRAELPNLYVVVVENNRVAVPECTSDKAVQEYKRYDAVIYNNGTMDELEQASIDFIDSLLKGELDGRENDHKS